MIRVTVRGDYKRTYDFLDRMQRRVYLAGLEKYGPIGVVALSTATPKESGETAASWTYQIVQRPGYYSIVWSNTHVDSAGTPIAVLLQYGHGTRNGGYVAGRDYINPTMRPIFDQIAADMWREVTK